MLFSYWNAQQNILKRLPPIILASAQCDALFTSRKETSMVAVRKLFCKNLSRWQRVAKYWKKRSEVKKLSFVKLQNTNPLLTKSGLIIKSTDVSSHSKIDPLCSGYSIIRATDVYVAHQGVRDLKRHCKDSIHKKTLYVRVIVSYYHWQFLF